MEEIKIHCNYPGGNIKVLSIEGDVIKVEQDLRDTTEWWFYWSFCVEDAQGRELTFEFMCGEVIGPWGPAVSRDRVNWNWLMGNNSYDKHFFKYKFKNDDSRVYFCFSLPYQIEEFEAFYKRYEGHPLMSRGILTISEQGREIPLLILGNCKSERHIFLTCRHHSCEASASYLLEGLLEYFLELKDSSLMQEYLIHVVPFVDIDGVENGDQGKLRSPHDHNRDYIKRPIYKATEALMNYAREKRITLAVDFHSTYKWGMRNDRPFLVSLNSPEYGAGDSLDCSLLHVSQINRENDRISYNRSYHENIFWKLKRIEEDEHLLCSIFFKNIGAEFSYIVEFPYFGVDSTVYSQKNCREFGLDFGKAIKKFLNEKPIHH